MVEPIKSIHDAFLSFRLRAEKASEEELIDSFVSVGALLALLSNENNSIFYGRRGTGKTHALKYISDISQKKDHEAIYIDMRTIGSNTSIYSDANKGIVERTSQLINDVMQELASNLYDLAARSVAESMHPEEILSRLDGFIDSISQVKIMGNVEETRDNYVKDSQGANIELGFNKIEPVLSSYFDRSKGYEERQNSKRSGMEIVHVDFGNISSSLRSLLEILPLTKVWLLIDEWSEVPIELQPYLADMLRRIILPLNKITVKIAAIEHRTNFIIKKSQNQYVGMELGADITANIDFDDFLVFDSNEEKSIDFFKQLLFNHFKNSDKYNEDVSNPDKLIQIAFTQHNAFSEFVRAVEGVLRDALNLASIAATKSYGEKISIEDVRSSAREWYNRDKQKAVKDSAVLDASLRVIIDEVIGKRSARAFMFASNVKNKVIDELFDARLLHLLKKNISGKDAPGERYDAYKIDYGCYVDRINTNLNPSNLFSDDDELKGVPVDDYRSIRRAILDVDMLPR